MSHQDGRIRAKDIDRDRTVRTLADGYADGQLDPDEYQRRTDAALVATYVDDLDALVADLQRPRQTAPRAPRTLPWRRIAVVAAGVLLVGGGIRGVQALGEHWPPGPDSAVAGGGSQGDSTQENGSPWVSWSEVRGDLPGERVRPRVELSEPRSWRLDADHIIATLEAYRSGVGTPYLREAQFHPEFANLNQPIAGTLARTRSWSVEAETGALLVGSVSTGVRDLPLMDLRDVDLEALRANIDHALSELHVQDAELLYVNLDWWQGRPQTTVYVTDPLGGGTGYLHTTLSGRIFQEVPA